MDKYVLMPNKKAALAFIIIASFINALSVFEVIYEAAFHLRLNNFRGFAQTFFETVIAMEVIFTFFKSIKSKD